MNVKPICVESNESTHTLYDEISLLFNGGFEVNTRSRDTHSH